MKRIQKFAAVNVIAALIGTGIPAMAAQEGYDAHHRGGVQYQSAGQRGDRHDNDGRNRNVRNDNRRDYDRGYRDDRSYRDDRGYRDDRSNGYSYAPAYGEPVYNDGYYDRDHRSHDGRAVAVIGGSAAAGALIGAAAGHGQGAVIGAVVGGIAGAVVNAAADHHHR